MGINVGTGEVLGRNACDRRHPYQIIMIMMMMMTIIIIIIITVATTTTTMIIIILPAERNVVQKEAEKKLKYKSLCIEIQRMWNLKCTIVPVIIGATGIVTRSLKKNLEAVPGKH